MFSTVIPPALGKTSPVKFGSSNLGDLDVELYPLKAHFSEDHISALRGCCGPKFLHTLENDPSLTRAPSTGDGGLPYNFFQRGVKNWLKMQ